MIARLPPPVRPGDRVGVAALSGPVDPERLAAGMRALADLGFEPVPARNLTSRHDLFAGDDELRLAAFHELALDPSLRAILFARGGHGLLRVLPGIDWELLGRTPRAYVGYSDLTPLLNAIVVRLGLVAFHGPMVAADLARGLDPSERASLLAALSGSPESELPLEGLATNPTADSEGRLVGGCLSMLVATLGTPWATDLDDGLLVLEDVAEPLYRLDRMLTHLGLSGSLAGVRGVLIGSMQGTDETLPSLASRVAGWASGRAVAWGLPVGHGGPNRTLPLGAVARIEAEPARLTIEVPGTWT